MTGRLFLLLPSCCVNTTNNINFTNSAINEIGKINIVSYIKKQDATNKKQCMPVKREA
jgi:hypothetical protein